MSAVAPLCLLLVAACILVFFYFHDKNILSGAAYETATTGSIKAREKDGVEPGELEALFAQRTGGKCILFAGAGAEVSVTEEEVAVNVTASGGGMRLSLCRKATVTEPEKKDSEYKEVSVDRWNARSRLKKRNDTRRITRCGC